MKSKTRVKRTPDKALKELERLSREFGKGPDEVKVGLPKDSNDYPDGTSVIMVGTVHEFGSPKMGIPERSYLRSTIQANKREYKELFKNMSFRIVKGTLDKKKALGLIGLKVQGDIQARMSAGEIGPPLVSRDGTPLWDTGHLIQSITFKVDE